MNKKFNVIFQKRRILGCIITLVILFYPVFLLHVYADGTERSLRIGSYFYVPTGTGISIPGDLYLSQGEFLKNDGIIYFPNRTISSAYLTTGDFGTGTFSFNGIDDYYIYVLSGEAKFESLVLNTTKSLLLSGNLKVSSSLKLNSGVVDVGENSKLTIDNSATESIQFNNSILNMSYVTGPLTRKINTGETYFYPVGSTSGFHPLFIENVGSSGTLTVNFDETIPSQWSALGTDQSIVLSPGIGWQIESDISGIEFQAGLSRIDRNSNLLNDGLGMFYSSDNSFLNPENDWNTGLTDGYYLKGLTKRSTGMYALSLYQGPKLTNFFLLGSGGSTHFEIPDIEQYSSVELIVFNRFGIEMFRSNKYLNELDVTDYPNGTYYYELNLQEGNDKQTIYNFLEIRHGK